MADDIESLLQERKQKLEERSQTLSGRLKELEEFRAANTPDVWLAQRPKGYSPLNLLGGYFRSLESQSSLERQRTTTEENLTNLLIELKKIQEEAESKETKIGGLTKKDVLELGLKGEEEDKELTYDTESDTWNWKKIEKTPEEKMAEVELKGNSKTDMEMAKDIYSTAKEARKNWKSEFSGILNFLGGKLGVKLNAKNAGEFQAFQIMVSGVNNAIRNYISGAAIPEAEMKYLKEQIIDWNDSDTEVKKKLEGAMGWATRKAQGILDTNQYDIDATEYLDTTGKKENLDPLLLR